MSEPLIPLIQSMLGGALIGAVLSFVLYGVTVAQAFTYVKNCGEDPRLTKVLVFAVFMIETSFSVFVLHMHYHFAIRSFDNVLDILPIPWSAGACLLSESFVVLTVQSFYVHSIWILSKHNVPLIIIAVLFVVARAVTEWVCVVFTYQANNWLEYQESRSTQLSVLFASVTLAIGDGIIAGTLIFYLSRSRSGVKRTDNIIRKILMYAVNTGALTMLVSISIAITFKCLASNLTYAGMTAIGCRTYANALLGMLNARKKLRSHLHHAPHVTRPRTQDGKTQVSVESDCSVQSYVSEPRPIEIYREVTSETYTDSMIAAGSIGVIPRTHANRGSWMSAAGIPAPVRGSGLRRI